MCISKYEKKNWLISCEKCKLPSNFYIIMFLQFLHNLGAQYGLVLQKIDKNSIFMRIKSRVILHNQYYDYQILEKTVQNFKNVLIVL